MNQPSIGVLDGSASKPSIYFHNDPDTGFYLISAGVVGLSIGGVLKMRLSATGMEVLPASAVETPGGWAITSFTEDKAFAGNSSTATDAVKAVASLVNDLISLGLIRGSVAA